MLYVTLADDFVIYVSPRIIRRSPTVYLIPSKCITHETVWCVYCFPVLKNVFHLHNLAL